MQDPIGIPASSTAGDKMVEDPVAATKLGQRIVESIYRTKITGKCRSVTVTWCKNLLVHGLSITVEGSKDQYSCKVELKPWSFWKKQGSKRFSVEGKPVDIFWDLKAVKFGRAPEPHSDYYVALVCEEEVVLLLGDLKKEAFRRTGSRPSLIDASLVSRKEHIFGKKKFCTKAKFHDKGKQHEISIECTSKRSSSGSNSSESTEPEMLISIDGHPAIHVKHLQWKFRGNESISVENIRVEVYWDAHDWLFGPGFQHALFIFKPIAASPSSLMHAAMSALGPTCSSTNDESSLGEAPGFCLYLYAWKVE